MNSDLKYIVDRGYPEIIDAIPCPLMVSKLQELYAGSDGEINAVLQYLYQHFVLKNENLQIAQLVEDIALVEMHHLELLANAIVAFGGNPRYVNAKNEFYSTQSVFYCSNVLHMLQKDIADEKNAIANYINTANSVNNDSVKRLLYQIVEDEKLHISLLEEAYKNELRRQQLTPNDNQSPFFPTPNFSDTKKPNIFNENYEMMTNFNNGEYKFPIEYNPTDYEYDQNPFLKD